MISCIIAYFIIPAYTLMFVSGTNWFSLNLSVIGNQNGSSLSFLLLGILIGVYYYFILGKIIRYLPSPKPARRLLTSALVLLLFAVTTPYLPSQLPFQAFLHIIFAFIAAILLLACLYLVVWNLSARRPERFSSYRIRLMVLTGLCAVLLLLIGIVSTALEVVFLLSSTVMVQRIYLTLMQEDSESLSFSELKE